MNTTLYTRYVEKKIKLTKLYKTFSPEQVLLIVLLASISASLFFSALIYWNKKFLLEVPTYGGSITEGIVGTPRFINPVLATTDQDKDLTALVFSGITKKTSGGSTIPDMAQSIDISDDKLHIHVTLKNNAYFHDGKKVTADDVLYTISLIQNPLIKSPHKIEWEGVDVTKQSDTEVLFTLKKPYPLFLETLSLGIIPKHVWKNLNEEEFGLSDLNINAVGSGPYMITETVRKSGIPTAFTLQAHEHYTLGRPYIEKIHISIYQNEKNLLQAFSDGDITRIHGIPPALVPQLVQDGAKVAASPLPRTFALFFNPNNFPPFADRDVRKALQLAIDKQSIVDTVLFKYGTTIDAPYPFDTEAKKALFETTEAKDLLRTNKTFKQATTTSITLATVNTEEMRKVAEMIKKFWEPLGIDLKIALYDVSDLNQSVIKDRNFQVLLFGAITETPSDLYAFWHSSQRLYPGLNVSSYVSKQLDQNLETLRNSVDEEERNNAYALVRQEFTDEVPGIFLYAPSLIYLTNDHVVTKLPDHNTDNSSRFLLVEEWYRYTDHVWKKTYYKPLTEFIQNIFH